MISIIHPKPARHGNTLTRRPAPATAHAPPRPGVSHRIVQATSVAVTQTHEGASLGILVATSTWIWIALVDLIAGNPFHTFTLLGGLGLYTLVHFALCIVYGIALTSMVRAALHEPSLILAVVFGSLLLGVAFGMVTVLLANIGLGALAWIRIFVGSVIGAAIALFVLARRYPVAEMMRQAHEER